MNTEDKVMTKKVRPKTLAREEFQTGVGKNLAMLRKYTQTLSESIGFLSNSHNADAAFPTFDQVQKLRKEMVEAAAATQEIEDLLRIRLQTKAKELT